MDLHLDEELELAEYKEKKNLLIEEKADLETKLSDFERKGNHWLELLRNWIFDANQAQNLVIQKNFSLLKNFLKTVGSNRILENGNLQINFNKPYSFLFNLPAESRAQSSSEAAQEALNLQWWTIAELNR